MQIVSTLPLMEGDTYLVTSPFGKRVDPFTGKTGAKHDGIDLVLWRGYGALSDIGAAWDGIVSRVSYDASRGNYVVIEHGEGVETHYYHLADGSVSVALGDHVAAGQSIGSMGSTGASTGAHLHFQIEINGEPVDPLPFILGEEERETEGSEVVGFSPQAKTNASAFETILDANDARLSAAFADNEPSEWSADAVLWALDNGILYGDENGNLMLHQPCTREQMVVFLHRIYKLITEGQA